MEKFFLILLLIGLLCNPLFAANPDTEISTEDYYNYLNSLNNVQKSQNDSGIPILYRNLFNFDRIEEQIRVIFSPEKINKGELLTKMRTNRHASLIVFFIALGGVAVLFYGYKLLPVLIMLFGAYLGSVATYNIVQRFFTVTNAELALFVILGTVIMAIASLLLRNIFIFLFGAAFGLFISQVVLTLFTFEISNTLLFTVFIAILFAVFVLLLKKFFMIFLTALTGSVLVVFSVQYLLLEVFTSLTTSHQFFRYLSLVLFLILLIVGSFFQFKTSRKTVDLSDS
ncbi:MAG TPA: DUF4203 domain-containing protein [Thermotogota bacterium]|nr:DUF4203 domain-containing protein [Thermotogota bacterium]HPJ90114.1 DUF4203 domain-containing protein [Thermotogota bacterium]HPR96014.1 DUF4203 domain-containing protein [Thermotogota bacterium]